MDLMRLQWVFFVLVTVCIILDLSTSQMLNIEPLKIEALVHQDFHFTCVASNSTEPYDLRWKFIFANGTQVAIHESHIIHLNESAVKLVHPGLPLEFDGCSIQCYNPFNVSVVASINIKEMHPTPKIVRYEMYNWEELRFEWQWENRSQTLDMKFKGWFKDSSAEHFTECPSGVNPNECIVRKKIYEIAPSAGIVHIKVNGSNRLQNISMDGNLFRLTDRIRPGRVRNLNVKTNPEDHSTILALFKPPQKESITYNISTSCMNGLFQMLKEETTEDFSQIRTLITVKLVGLPANSNCTVSVNGKPSQGGFWSPTETVSFQTLESVPLATPSMCRNCFDLRTKGRNLRDALIYFKPLPYDLAQGKVTGYRIQYSDSQTRHVELFDSSSFMHRLYNLSDDDNYRVTIEAKTTRGFNETLQTSVTVIEKSANLRFMIEKFVVTSDYQNTFMTSWASLNNASSYTLFWCKSEAERICKDVLSWIELPASYSLYNISLTPGLDYSNYIFGIASTWNGYSSAVQWGGCIYNIQATAEPPSIGHNYSTSDEILFGIKKSLACGQGAGFILKYIIYFCPISEEKSQHCIAGMQQMSVDGWTEEVRLTGLASDQTYLIVAESWTYAGRSTQNATKVLATKPSDTIAVGFIVLIAFACVICVVLVSIGLCSIIRFYRRSIVRYKQWLTVGITTPPGKTAENADDQAVAEQSNGSGGYAAVSESEYSARTSRPLHETEELTKENKIEEQIHIDVLPIKRRSDQVDVPLFSEERLLPPISRVTSHGSSPSVMLHSNKTLSSPERQRILPSIRGKPAYVKPLQRENVIEAETVPMVSSSDIDSRKPTDDNSESESNSYAYVRQRHGLNDFLETSLSEAAPLKLMQLPDEDCIESVSDSIECTDIKTIGVGEHILENTTASFECLPPLDSKIC